VTAPARRLLRRAAPALALYAAVRTLGVLAVVLWGLPHSNGLHALAHVWDAGWYQDVARHGYAHGLREYLPARHMLSRYTNLAFFPAYPALIAAVHAVLPFTGWGQAALLAAWAASLAAAAGVYAAVERAYGGRAALFTTVLWGMLPSAVVESLAYSEALFTAFAAWALWALLANRPLTAGLLASLAGLTRPTGAAVAAAVVVGAGVRAVRVLRRRGPSGARQLVRPPAAALLAPLGWIGFILWTGYRLHSWDGYFEVQRRWNSTFDFGRGTARDMLAMLEKHGGVPLSTPVTASVLLVSAVFLALGVIRRQPLPFTVYGAVLMLIAVGDSSHFGCRGRFLLPGFTLLLPAALALARSRSRITAALLLASAAVCSALYGCYLVYVAPGPP